MISIYKNSDRVIIDIGERSTDSDLAMHTIADVTGRVSEAAMTSVSNLLARPWFSRIWGKHMACEVVRGTNCVFKLYKKWPALHMLW
jgi:hypothetical protein